MNSRMLFRTTARTSVAVVALTLLTPQARAEVANAVDTADTSAHGVEEIVVTARRTKESLETTGVAVSAFSASRLESLNIKAADDLSRYTPNLTLKQSNDASTGLVIKIRGIGQSDVDFTASDPSIAVYIDGVFQARTFGPQFSLFDLERVEVLRGPQGTLYGKNALGGAINIVTAKPSANDTASLDVSAGNYGALNFSGRVGGALIEDKLFIRISAESRFRNGFYRNAYLPDGTLNDENRQAGRIALRWLPSSSLTVDLTVDDTRSKQSTPTVFLAQALPGTFATASAAAVGLNLNDYVVGASPSQSRLRNTADDFGAGYGSFLPPGRGTNGQHFSDANFYGASLVVTADLTPKSHLTSTTGYRHFDHSISQDLDGTPVPIVDGIIHSKGYTLTQEFQYNAKLLNDRLDLVVGAFGLYEDLNDEFTQGLLLGLADTSPPLQGISVHYIYGHRNLALATYTHAIYKVTDKLRLTAGLRYGYERKKADFREGQLATEGVFQILQDKRSRNFQSTTPQFGAEYTINKNLFGYATIAKGYASGGFVSRVDTAAAGVESFNPERLWSYEAGLKSTLLDNSVRLNLAAFHMDYTNIVVTSFGASSTGVASVGAFTKNAGAATVNGVEVDAEWRPIQSLTLTGSAGLLKQKFLNFGIGPNGNPIDPKMAHFFDSPNKTVNLQLRYTVPIDPTQGDLQLTGNWSYRSRVYFDNGSSIVSSQPGYSLFDGQLSYTFPNGRLKITAFGQNLANKVYINRSLNVLASPFGLATAQFGPPRTEGVRIGYKF